MSFSACKDEAASAPSAYLPPRAAKMPGDITPNPMAELETTPRSRLRARLATTARRGRGTIHMRFLQQAMAMGCFGLIMFAIKELILG